MGHAEVDQAGFLAAGDDLHRIAQHVLRTANELVGVAGHPEGVGAHHLNRVPGHALQPLGKAPKAVQCALLSLLGEAVEAVEACSQLHLLPHLLQGPDFAVHEAGHHHVETVGAHVDGRQHSGFLGRGCVCHFLG